MLRKSSEKTLEKSYEAALEGGMKPEVPIQQKKDKEAISKMYEYFSTKQLCDFYGYHQKFTIKDNFQLIF